MSSHIQLKVPISARLAGPLPPVHAWPFICQRTSGFIEMPETGCRSSILSGVYRTPHGMLPVLEARRPELQLAQFSRALIWRAAFETNPPWNLLQYRRSEKSDGRVSLRLE